jgi:hypothetical protein
MSGFSEFWRHGHHQQQACQIAKAWGGWAVRVPAGAAAHQLPVTMLLPAGYALNRCYPNWDKITIMQTGLPNRSKPAGANLLGKTPLPLTTPYCWNQCKLPVGHHRGMLHHWQHQHNSLQPPSNKQKSRKQGDKSQLFQLALLSLSSDKYYTGGPFWYPGMLQG